MKKILLSLLIFLPGLSFGQMQDSFLGYSIKSLFQPDSIEFIYIVFATKSGNYNFRGNGDTYFSPSDSCKDDKICKANFVKELSSYMQEESNKKYEMQAKIRFYEKYFGKINGSPDEECIEVLPPKEKPKSCKPVQKNSKKTPKKVH
jgi:hypothetical protein